MESASRVFTLHITLLTLHTLGFADPLHGGFQHPTYVPMTLAFPPDLQRVPRFGVVNTADHIDGRDAHIWLAIPQRLDEHRNGRGLLRYKRLKGQNGVETDRGTAIALHAFEQFRNRLDPLDSRQGPHAQDSQLDAPIRQIAADDRGGGRLP